VKQKQQIVIAAASKLFHFPINIHIAGEKPKVTQLDGGRKLKVSEGIEGKKY